MGQLGGASRPIRASFSSGQSARPSCIVQLVTAEDVQAAAKKYLTPDKAWKLVVNPEKK